MLVERHPTRPGTAQIREMLARFADQGGARRTRSEAEIALLTMCDTYNLITPLTNHHIHGHEVDASWAHADLVVEVDSRRFCRTPAQRAYDARKRLEIQAQGTEVIVLTYAQATSDAGTTSTALRRRLLAD